MTDKDTVLQALEDIATSEVANSATVQAIKLWLELYDESGDQMLQAVSEEYTQWLNTTKIPSKFPISLT